ncbi:MAG TPA: ComEC/Rec2 family competence protein, partial [Rubrobacteraceae bacterium]|nr:ComEC/Rec2 family competence protein [Rubrobacteraceae bacterium]
MQRSEARSAPQLRLDLKPPVRLDAWALAVAAGIVAGTVLPSLGFALVVASLILALGATFWRELVSPEWRLMAILSPVFAVVGVGIAFLHLSTPDPLAQLAAMEPGEVILAGEISSPPAQSSFGYRADVRVEHLWYEGEEILRGGGVEVFASDLSVGVGDEVRVDGEISVPEPGEDGFDYAKYLATKRISAT